MNLFLHNWVSEGFYGVNFVVVGGKVFLEIYFQQGVVYFVMTRAQTKLLHGYPTDSGFLKFLS
jgi:hypothetical protein